MTWFLFAFLTAIFDSLKDIASKKTLREVNAYVVAWAWMFFPVPFLFVATLIQGFPSVEPRFWGIVFATALTLMLSFILYTSAIKISDLSLSIPMIAFTPIFLLITSPLMVGEFPAPSGLFGIVLIVAGSYVLNIKEKRRGLLAPYRALIYDKGPKMMLGVAFLWSITANLDKIGIQNSSPFFWVMTLNFCTSMLMLPIVLWKTRDLTEIPRNVGKLTLIGFFISMVAMTQMTALTMTLVPYVIAVKRTSIVLSVLAGHIFFKEKGLQERLTGVLIMIAGVVFITLSS